MALASSKSRARLLRHPRPPMLTGQNVSMLEEEGFMNQIFYDCESCNATCHFSCAYIIYDCSILSHLTESLRAAFTIHRTKLILSCLDFIPSVLMLRDKFTCRLK